MLETQDRISIELPTTIRLYVNDEQFAELARVNRDLRLEKTAAGELIVNSPTGGESGRRNFSLTGQLGRWHEQHENLGEAFDLLAATCRRLLDLFYPMVRFVRLMQLG